MTTDTTPTYLERATVRYLRELDEGEVPTGAGLRAFIDADPEDAAAFTVATDDQLADAIDAAMDKVAEWVADPKVDEELAQPVRRKADDPDKVLAGTIARVGDALDATDEALGYVDVNQSALPQGTFVVAFAMLTSARAMLADALPSDD